MIFEWGEALEQHDDAATCGQAQPRDTTTVNDIPISSLVRDIRQFCMQDDKRRNRFAAYAKANRQGQVSPTVSDAIGVSSGHHRGAATTITPSDCGCGWHIKATTP